MKASFRCIACLFLSALVASPVLAEEEQEIDVGHSAAGQLKAVVEFTPPAVLPVSIFPGINGYATGLIGIHSIIMDEPGEDFFQFPVSPPGDFRLILLAKDPGIEIWTGTEFLPVGGSYFIGEAPFDTHPIWNITTGTPGNVYSLTLKFHDINGVYPDSDPVLVSFTPIPEPAAIALIVVLMGLGLPRRRLS